MILDSHTIKFIEIADTLEVRVSGVRVGRIVIDEIWLHHFTPEPNRSDSPNPKRGKTR